MQTSPGYARRGGFYAVTGHDFADQDSRFGFQQIDYEAVQHIPILRETWVVSLRGRAETTLGKDDQQVPFYLMPSLGGGNSLRGYSSWRFRGRNSLLLQGEWRFIVNRAFETALFYDAGKVEERSKDLDLDDLITDYGFGARFHTCRDRAARRACPQSRGTPAGVRDVRSVLKARHAMKLFAALSVAIAAFTLLAAPSATTSPRFYSDDPIAREPESQDASGAAPSELVELYETATGLFAKPGYKPSGLRAKNLSTIEEVPDSSWFTNRVGARTLTIDEIAVGRSQGHRRIHRAGSSSGKRPPAAIRALLRRTPTERPGFSNSTRATTRTGRRPPW